MSSESTPDVGSGPPGSQDVGFGIDVGGTGIKGGLVDLRTGALIGNRVKIATPTPATPDAVAGTVRQIVDKFQWQGAIGITLPAVVRGGIVQTAANIDKSWIGLDAAAMFSAALDGLPVHVLNDADAAGLAEDRFGGGREQTGVVVLLTLGTGIGSAVLNDGVLLPNTEFGHLEVDGKEAEHRAAASVRAAKDMSWHHWTKEVSRVLKVIENLISPDLIIVGGGISREGAKWIPLLTNRTPVTAATLHNSAGIVGAAMLAAGLTAAVAP
ncbi:polyphosphate--glucose phosphotransferase [Tomitella biformata]|uniref:polyphosphate--glucose phosphotransferase n=1 Tax=Tomitella biformata TaxID=630403 RepID=UPI0004632EA5|nr:ROK family protein [Tomitella biformata]